MGRPPSIKHPDDDVLDTPSAGQHTPQSADRRGGVRSARKDSFHRLSRAHSGASGCSLTDGGGGVSEDEFHDARSCLSRLSVGSNGSGVFVDATDSEAVAAVEPEKGLVLTTASPRERRPSFMEGLGSKLGWGPFAHGAPAVSRTVSRTSSLCRQLQATPPPWVPPHPLRSLGRTEGWAVASGCGLCVR